MSTQITEHQQSRSRTLSILCSYVYCAGHPAAESPALPCSPSPPPPLPLSRRRRPFSDRPARNQAVTQSTQLRVLCASVFQTPSPASELCASAPLHEIAQTQNTSSPSIFSPKASRLQISKPRQIQRFCTESEIRKPVPEPNPQLTPIRISHITHRMACLLSTFNPLLSRRRRVTHRMAILFPFHPSHFTLHSSITLSPQAHVLSP